MRKSSSFDVEKLIAAVAEQHRLLLKPDDAAFAIVTMNRVVLEESIQAIHTSVVEDLAQFHTVMQSARQRAESAIGEEIRRSAAALREEIQCDVDNARLQATEIVRRVEAAYRQPMSDRNFALVALAVLLLLHCGVWLGRISAAWWPV